MKVEKLFIIACLLILLFSVASASAIEIDNQTDIKDTSVKEVISVSNDEADIVSQNDAEVNTTVSDVSVATVDNDAVAKVSNVASVESDGDVLGAPAERDVLGYTFSQLKSDIGDNSKSVVTFTSNVVRDGTDIDISRSNFLIEGNGFTFDVNTNQNILRRGFVISANQHDIIFQNLTITDAYSQHEYGGAIRAYAGVHDITFKNCIFDKNNNHDFGAGLSFAYGCYNINFINCKFIGNTVWNRGGAVYVAGSNANNCHDFTFTNCYFEGNTANHYALGYDQSYGAAVYMEYAYGMKFNNCTFDGNKATRDGAAIFSASTCHDISIKNSTFKDNSVSRNGGAIYWGNHDNDFIIYNSSFIGNEAPQGATVYFAYAPTNIDIQNTTFSGNKVTSGTGGALNVPTTTASVNIFNSTFKDNQASNGGSAVYIPNGVGTADINNSTFINNDCTSNNGGAIYWGISYKFVTSNSTFKDNDAVLGSTIYFAAVPSFIDIKHSKFINNKVTSTNAGVGGALSVPQNTGYINITNTLFDGNVAPLYGGAVYIPTGVNIHDFFNDTFTNNKVTDSNSIGGAIVIVDDGGNFDFVNCDFIKNSAGTASSVYLGSSSTLKNIDFIDSSFIGNTATSGTTGVYFTVAASDCTFNNVTIKDNSGPRGAIIYFHDTATSIDFINMSVNNNNVTSGNGAVMFFEGTSNDIDIIDSNFTSNTASGNAGVINFYTTSNDINIVNSNFTHNTANSGYGGAVYFSTSGNTINVIDSTFDSNKAQSGGALMFYSNANNAAYNTVNIKNSNFTNNNCTGTDLYGGSAIALNRANNVKFINDTFYNNNAANQGAVLLDYYYTVTFTDCNFTHNTANMNGGSAVYMYRTLNTNSKVNFTGTVFDDNRANGNNGGAVYFYDDGTNYKNYATSFVNCNFTNNKGYQAPAIMWTNSQNGIIDNCMFVNNTANIGSGAVYVYKGTNLLINNTDFIHNVAKDENAGAVKLSLDSATSTNARIYNSNFENNTADDDGGALYITSAYNDIKNNNFTNNSAGRCGGAIYLSASNTNILDNNFTLNKVTPAHNLGTNNGGGAIWVHGDNIVIQSTFANNTATNYGGAVLITDGKNTYINASLFINNFAANGGAVDIYSASEGNNVSILNSKFFNNTATEGAGAVWFSSIGGVIKNCEFTQNNATYGGALVMGLGNEEIINSTFKQNHAKSSGGAICNNATWTSFIRNSTFISNTAINGGAIHSIHTSGDTALLLFNDTFLKNIATHNGGATYIKYNNTLFSDYNLFNQHAKLNQTSGRETFENNPYYMPYFIYESLFEENMDYLINVTAEVSGLTAVITVNVPRDAKGYVKVIVYSNVTGANINNAIIKDGVVVDGKIVNATLINAEIIKGIMVDGSLQNASRTEGNLSGVTIIDCTIPSGDIIGASISNGVITEGHFDKIKTNTTIVDGTLIFNVPIGAESIADLQTLELTTADGEDGVAVLNLPNMPTGYYNVTAILENDEFLHKENNTNFSITNPMGDFTILQNLIKAALGRGDENFTLPRSFTFTPLLDTGHMYINGTIRIIGNGKILDALDHCRIFEIFGPNVVLDGIVFVNGKNLTSEGGAILWRGTNGTIINSEFMDNQAKAGGAVFVTDNSTGTKIINSTFTDLNATTNGGAVYWNGTDGSIFGSTFKNNNATYGGGLFVGNGASNLKISKSVFESNNATFNGGAIDCNGTQMNLTNTKFISNEAVYGAALCRE